MKHLDHAQGDENGEDDVDGLESQQLLKGDGAGARQNGAGDESNGAARSYGT